MSTKKLRLTELKINITLKLTIFEELLYPVKKVRLTKFKLIITLKLTIFKELLYPVRN